MTDTTQPAKSNTLLIVLLLFGGFIGLLLLIGGIAGVSWYSAYKEANIKENQIQGQYSQNQNSLSTLSNSIFEAAQVPGMARDDLTAVIKAGIEGRYGANGSQAMFQAMKEAYPGTLDASLYTKLQNMIEAKRNDFSNEQKLLIDKVAIYKTELGSPWQGLWMGIAGFPKIDLTKYKPVTSDYSDKAFESGKDSGLKLR